MTISRRLPIGAEVVAGRGVHFRVWSPEQSQVEAVILPAAGTGHPGSEGTRQEPRAFELTAEGNGYFAGLVSEATAGDRYRFRFRGGATYPDPASRFQPEGGLGPSQVVGSGAFRWTDDSWNGVTLPGQVIYELHLGTFTPEGTLAAAMEELARLAETGITIVELMPVAEFVGRFGWGYDGVDLFAPTHLYGQPDDLRRFVDRAHQVGLGVLLDVVYNHFGPVGNYWGEFSRHYFSEKHKTDWGAALNFDGPSSGPVREFFIANAGYWIEEYHVDGLRIDAIQAIVDDSPVHVLAEIVARARQAAGRRSVLVVGENEFQEARALAAPAEGGWGLDAVWNDDFHHAARVAMTGHNEFYYGDYRGTPQELISAVKWGYLYQGQWNARQQRRRGTPARDLPAACFVTFLQNHDQVANSAQGLRAPELTSPGRYRAMTALWLLAPGTPMFFQGQEYGASTPFLFFADHDVELAQLVREGRQEFLRQFQSLAGAEPPGHLAEPCDLETFARSKLDPHQRRGSGPYERLHRDLLRLRRQDPVFSLQDSRRLFGAVIDAEAFLLRYFGPADDDRLLLVNLGRDLVWTPVAEPLSSAPQGTDWAILWSSEDPRYGGSGTCLLDTHRWRIPGHATVVLRPEPMCG